MGGFITCLGIGFLAGMLFVMAFFSLNELPRPAELRAMKISCEENIPRDIDCAFIAIVPATK